MLARIEAVMRSETTQGDVLLGQDWLNKNRPPFLDLLDAAPAKAASQLYTTMYAVLKVPRFWPPKFSSLQPEQREEVISNKFMYLIRRDFAALKRFEDQGVPFGGYLKQILDRAAWDLIRKHQRETEYDPTDYEGVGDEREASAEELIRIKRLHKDSLRLMREVLSPTEMVAILLRHYDGCHIDEIVELLNLDSPDQASSILANGLRKLRRRLKP